MVSMKKRILPLLVVMSMLTSMFGFTASAFDDVNSSEVKVTVESGEVVTIQEDVYDDAISISADEATEIAKLFVQDALAFDDANWNESTQVEKVVSMYDQTDEQNITAYAVELTEGYVVVSAFLDAASLIPEWSDSAEPIYDALDLSAEDQILYLGAYEYYKDSGADVVESLDGDSVEKETLVNQVEEMRSADNIPDATLEAIALDQAESGISTAAAITDPFTHANNNYAGPFVSNDFVNLWGNYAAFKRTSDFSGYNNHCGPTAISNMVLTYGNRYPTCISYPSAASVFSNVARIGTNNGYFSSAVGTPVSTAGSYIGAAFNSYAITTSIISGYQTTYSNIKSQLANNALLYVALNNHSLYGNHAVMCFAYTRLISQSTGFYKTYLKVSDGWYSSARYIDLATTTSSTFVSVRFP